MSDLERFFKYNWKLLAIHFLLPLVLIGPATWGMLVNYTKEHKVDSWIPDQEGALQCIYSNVTFWIEGDTMCANITGMTINSTICPNIEMPYWEGYYEPRGQHNHTKFEGLINRKFPIGQTINCSVYKDCSMFNVFQFPEYQIEYTAYALFRIMGIAMIFAIIILPVTGLYYTRKKWQAMKLSGIYDKLMPI